MFFNYLPQIFYKETEQGLAASRYLLFPFIVGMSNNFRLMCSIIFFIGPWNRFINREFNIYRTNT